MERALVRIAITRIGKPGWCNNDFRFHPRWQTTSISSNQDFRKWNLFLFSVKLLKKELALASLYFSGLQIRLDDSWKFTCMGQLRFGIYYPWEDLKVFTTIQNIFKFSTIRHYKAESRIDERIFLHFIFVCTISRLYLVCLRCF